MIRIDGGVFAVGVLYTMGCPGVIELEVFPFEPNVSVYFGERIKQPMA